MELYQKILLFFVLPAIAPLIYPPENLLENGLALGLAVVLFLALGYLLWRGHPLALTLSIFLQGLNVIVRVMMVFPHAVTAGQVNFLEIFSALISIALSFYLLMRLDKTDVRVQMIRG